MTELERQRFEQGAIILGHVFMGKEKSGVSIVERQIGRSVLGESFDHVGPSGIRISFGMASESVREQLSVSEPILPSE